MTKCNSAGSGVRLRLLRESLGIKNKSKFARAIGVRPETLWRFESGKCSPGAATLLRAAAATNVSIDWLVTGKGKGPSSSPRNEVK